MQHALGVQFCAVLEFLPAERQLVLSAGAGWRSGAVGTARLDATLASQAGQALLLEQPVAIDGPEDARRFASIPWLDEHAVVSGLSVPIRHDGGVCGVLSVHSFAPRVFDDDALARLTSAAQVIGLAGSRQREGDRLRREATDRRLVFDHAPDIQLCIEPGTGTIMRCSSSVQSVLGLDPQELQGAAVGQLFHPEDASRAASVLDALACCTPLRDAEVQVRRHDGTKLDMSVSASPIRDSHGQVSFCLTVWRDVSARRRAERALTAERPFAYAAAYELAVAEERERLRIARGLHDDLEETIAVVKLTAGQLRDSVSFPDVRAGAARIQALLGEASHTIRRVAVQLGSPLLQQLGLEAGLRSLGARVASQCTTRFEFDIDPQLGAVTEETRLLLFRVARELLLNIQMHARAGNAKLSLRRVAKLPAPRRRGRRRGLPERRRHCGLELLRWLRPVECWRASYRRWRSIGTSNVPGRWRTSADRPTAFRRNRASRARSKDDRLGISSRRTPCPRD